MKNNFPNAIGDSDDVIYYIKSCEETFNEYYFNGEKTIRFFNFIENQLYWVGVSYGQYSNGELDLFKENLQKIFGTFPIEDNGTIEEWYLEMKEYNTIVFTINKLQNNTLNASYMNPYLRDKYWKESIIIQ